MGTRKSSWHDPEKERSGVIFLLVAILGVPAGGGLIFGGHPGWGVFLVLLGVISLGLAVTIAAEDKP